MPRGRLPERHGLPVARVMKAPTVRPAQEHAEHEERGEGSPRQIADAVLQGGQVVQLAAMRALGTGAGLSAASYPACGRA